MAPWGLISRSKLSVCALWAKGSICISAHLCSCDFLLKCHRLSGTAKPDGGIINMYVSLNASSLLSGSFAEIGMFY